MTKYGQTKAAPAECSRSRDGIQAQRRNVRYQQRTFGDQPPMSNQTSNIKHQTSPLRVGIFGGSFDPVHRGHLVLAQCCLEQAELDAVWFVPADEQPLKPDGPQASGARRLAMLELAVEDCAEFSVSTIELDRGGVSYTVDTLESLCEEEPTAELFFLMGADSLAELPRWHRATEVCKLATPLIVHRAGAEEPNFRILHNFLSLERADKIERLQVEMPATPISSSQIRQLIAAGSDWDEMVVPRVAEYIREHRLYFAGR